MAKLGLVAKMRDARAFIPILVIFALNFGLSHSAVVPKNGIISIRIPSNSLNETDRKENITMEVLEEAMDDYLDLSDAFYGPAASEAVREKRTLRIFRTIANRTRAGVRSLRNLFSGRRGGSSSEDGEAARRPGGRLRSFGKFFSNLLNRILGFLTQLWDRITGFFTGRRGEDDEGEGESKRPSLVTRIRTGASSLAKRLRGRGGGGESSSGGLSGILSSFSALNPKTTPEPYVVDYEGSDDDKVADELKEKEKEAEKDVEKEGITDPVSVTPAVTSVSTENPPEIISVDDDAEGGYGGYAGSNAVRSIDDGFISDNSAASANHYASFIPFPMDSDPNYHLNPASSYYTGSRRVASSQPVSY